MPVWQHRETPTRRKEKRLLEELRVALASNPAFLSEVSRVVDATDERQREALDQAERGRHGARPGTSRDGPRQFLAAGVGSSGEEEETTDEEDAQPLLAQENRLRSRKGKGKEVAESSHWSGVVTSLRCESRWRPKSYWSADETTGLTSSREGADATRTRSPASSKIHYKSHLSRHSTTSHSKSISPLHPTSQPTRRRTTSRSFAIHLPRIYSRGAPVHQYLSGDP